MTRIALIFAPAARVAPYLPSNYSIADEDVSTATCIVTGEDSCGWTLDDYVLPRLASGLIFGEEVTDVVA